MGLKQLALFRKQHDNQSFTKDQTHSKPSLHVNRVLKSENCNVCVELQAGCVGIFFHAVCFRVGNAVVNLRAWAKTSVGRQ